MDAVNISRGGQISLPAHIRRRWATKQLLVDDLGDAVVLRPMPADPIAAARGALAPARVSVDAARARERREDAAREGTRRPPRRP